MGWFSDNELLIQSALASTVLAYSVQMALRSGVFSLASVGFWAIGGYTTARLVMDGWATAPAIAVAIVVSAVIAVILSLVLGRLRSLYLAMATVAFVLLVQIVAVNWESFTGGPAGLFGIPVTMSTWQLLAVVVVVSLGLVWYEHGQRGRRIEALRVDEQLAQSLGVDVVRERIKVFVLSGALGCLAGGMSSVLFNTLAPEQAGFHLIATTLMMVVIGGTGAWWGALVGAFIVTWLPEVFRFAEDYRMALQGALVVAVLVFAPEGIVGLVHDLRRWIARRRRPSPRPVAGVAHADRSVEEVAS